MLADCKFQPADKGGELTRRNRLVSHETVLLKADDQLVCAPSTNDIVRAHCTIAGVAGAISERKAGMPRQSDRPPISSRVGIFVNHRCFAFVFSFVAGNSPTAWYIDQRATDETPLSTLF